MTPVVLLRQIFDEAIAAVQPSICLPKHIPNPPLGRTIVLGAGKASAAMAKTLEEKWPWPLEGLVITRYGHKIENKRINIVEASHPIPDQIGLKASQQILEYTKVSKGFFSKPIIVNNQIYIIDRDMRVLEFN